MLTFAFTTSMSIIWKTGAIEHLAEIEDLKKQLEVVNDALRDCNYTDCGCCNAVRAAIGEDES